MRNSNKTLVLYVFQFLIVLALGIYLVFFGQWKIETNLLSLLPQSSQHQDFTAAERALFAEKEQQLLVLISGKEAAQASRLLHSKIKDNSHVKVLKYSEPRLSEIADFYLPYKHNFLSDEYQNQLKSSEGLTRLVNEQIIAVSNPFVGETIAKAPRLALAHYLQTSLNSMSAIELHQGFPVVEFNEHQYFMTRLATSFDGFSLALSEQLARELQGIFKEIETEFKVEINYSGILFHTAESAVQAQNEISLFGLASILCVLLLILFTFKSFTPVILSVVVLSISVLYGLTALLIFFEELHLLTLVFAVTLIGIVIDYCFHRFVYGEKSLQTREENKITQRVNIVKPLCLGFLTTVLGYLSLLFSPLSLLSQVAVFMMFGLFGALISVLFLLPHLKLFTRFEVSQQSLKVSKTLIQLITKVHARKGIVFSVVFLVIVTAFIKQPTLFNDDVRLLNSSPQWLLENEQFTGRVMGYSQTTRVVVMAESIQSALEIQEFLEDKIHQLQPSLIIKSVSGVLPSIKRQQRDHEQLNVADEQGMFLNALALTGLTAPVLNFTPLTYEAFNKGPLSAISDVYVVESVESISSLQSNNRSALWLELSGENLLPHLKHWINQHEKLKIYDRAGDVTKVLAQYRHGLLGLLLISLLVVAIVLVAKYGLIAGGLSTIATVLSALVALAFSQYFTGYLNIFNLLGILLILALAIDYVIFYQEHGMKSRTFIAISLSALSSAAVFGMLMFSNTPAVNSFGLTVMVGIMSIYFLAPLACVRKAI